MEVERLDGGGWLDGDFVLRSSGRGVYYASERLVVVLLHDMCLTAARFS